MSRDGSITQLVDEGHVAWHAGSREWNDRSLGIEIEATENAQGLTVLQQDSLVKLLKHITLNHKIARSNIKSHRSVRPHPTACPGFVWATDADLEEWLSAHL